MEKIQLTPEQIASIDSSMKDVCNARATLEAVTDILGTRSRELWEKLYDLYPQAKNKKCMFDEQKMILRIID